MKISASFPAFRVFREKPRDLTTTMKRETRILLFALGAIFALANLLSSFSSGSKKGPNHGSFEMTQEEDEKPLRHEEQHSSTTYDQTAVFLNAFIPGNDQYIGKEWEISERVSLEIIAEQVAQMADSGRSSDIHVYVTSVSPKPNVLNQTHLDDLCHKASNGSIPCTLSRHIDSGGELDTLSGLYEYCQQHNSATTLLSPSSLSPRVIYVHNKGSFHPSTKNTLWRRAMTAAVVHDSCLSPPNQTCSACGLQFSAPPKMFTNLFPGNFFAASCEYILQLWHPKEYKQKQEAMIRQVFHWRKKGRFHFHDKDDKGWAIGSGRYVPEHWIGSHPFLQPCDLSIPENYWYWHEHSVNETADWEFSMFPRNHTRMSTSHQQNIEKQLSMYKFLAGQLYRHLYLYNATPPLTSWMYDYYPDGDFWRALVQRYSSKVVQDFVLEPRMNRTYFFEYFTQTGSLPPMDD